MVVIKSEKRSYGISFPTGVEEITPDMLAEITRRVALPKNYCIIMLAFRTRLFDFVVDMNNRKSPTLSVVPVMAKISDEDAELVNSHVGDKVVIDRSSLERGIHLHLPVMISSSMAKAYFESDKDLCKAIMTKQYETDADEIVIAEFKIVPVCDIAASVPAGDDPADPFLYRGEAN